MYHKNNYIIKIGTQTYKHSERLIKSIHEF